MTKVKVKLNLDPNRSRPDQISCAGMIVFPDDYVPTEFARDGIEAVFSFGGVETNPMDLIYRGNSPTNGAPLKRLQLRDSNGWFRMSWKFRKRITPGKPNAAKIRVKLVGSGYAEILSDNGYLDELQASTVIIPVSLRVGEPLFKDALVSNPGTTRFKESETSFGFQWKKGR